MLESRARQWWIAIVAGMASYVDAASISGFSACLVVFKAEFQLSPVQVGVGAGVLTLAIAVGALVGGRAGDRFGRRPVFVATMAVIVGAAVLLCVASSAPMIFLAAGLLGLATGADLPVALAAISESAEEQLRPRLLTLSNLLWVAGIVVNLVLVRLFGDLGEGLILVLFGHIAVVAGILLVLRLGIPESTHWAAARAEKADGADTVRATRERVRDLLHGRYLAPLVSLLVFYSLTNMVANTNGQFGPYILVTYAGTTLSGAALVMLLSVPVVVVGLLVLMRIAASRRRFAFFTVGALCGVVAPLLLAIFGISVVTYATSVVLSGVAIAFAFEAMMKIWTQESFPTLLRATAQGAVIATARVSAAILAVFTPSLLQLAPSYFYAGLAACELVGVGSAWLYFRRHDGDDQLRVEAQRVSDAEL